MDSFPVITVKALTSAGKKEDSTDIADGPTPTREGRVEGERETTGGRGGKSSLHACGVF